MADFENMSDDEISAIRQATIDRIAAVKGAMEANVIICEEGVLANIGSKVRITLNGQTYQGVCAAFDGERIIIVDDLQVGTIIWLKSGVVLTKSKSNEG